MTTINEKYFREKYYIILKGRLEKDNLLLHPKGLFEGKCK